MGRSKLTEERIKQVVMETMKAWVPGQIDSVQREVDAEAHARRTADASLSSRIVQTDRKVVELDQRIDRLVETSDTVQELDPNEAWFKDLVDGQNLKRAELAEKRLADAERQLTELRRLNVNQRRTIIDTAKARDQMRADLRRANNENDVLTTSLDNAKDAYVNAATERDMAEAAYDRLAEDVRRVRVELKDRRGAAQEYSNSNASWNGYYQGRAEAYEVALEKLDRIL